MKKLIAILTLVILMVVTFAFSASAFVNDPYYSNLPEPIPTDNFKAFVFLPSSDSTTQYPFIYCFYNVESDFQIEIQINSNGYWEFGSLSQSETYVLYYQAITGRFIRAFTIQPLATNTTTFNINTHPYYSNYGCVLHLSNSSYNLDQLPALGQIYWSARSNEDHWTFLDETLSVIGNWIQGINDSSYDTSVSVESIRNYVATIITYLRDVTNPRLRNILDKCTSIENKCDQIISLLQSIANSLDDGEEQTTIASPDSSQLVAYNQAENAVMQDYSSGINNAFQLSQGVSTWNNAFQLLSSTFQFTILNNAKLNLLIMFALGLGLATFIIGRKIH